MKRIVLALAILALPLPAAAHRRPCVDSEARCCVEGTVWDADSGACVPLVG